ncbi:MAG: thiol-disulfide isomerase/thioredoxin [Roseivirga sp.]|jgi:thiol-disulfide isomerase/thioredoxin
MKATKTTLLVLLLGLFNTTMYGQESFNFNVKGKVINDFEGYIYFSYGAIEDSFLVKDKSFEFQGQVPNRVEAKVHTKGGYVSDSFYLDDGTTTVSIYVEGQLTRIKSIKGNKTHEILIGLQSFFEENEDQADFQNKMYQKLDKVISENPSSQFSGSLLGEVIMDPIFSFEEAMSLYSKLDTTVQDKFDLSAMKVSLDKLKNSKMGKPFSSFAMPNVSGKMININDYKGSFLLVEFWASWCGGCRIANPELVKIREKFMLNGFDIVGISLDESRTAWLSAIEKDGLTWENTLAEGGFKNKTIEELKLQYLPSNYLLDREGKIVAINVSPKVLRVKLTELFDQESDK